jgi:hypothetical protein
MLIKTFFYLRIIDSLSFLVSMLMQVFIDLGPFMLFYFILLVINACLLSIIDWGNYEFDDNDAVRLVQYTSTGPDKEYMLINKFLARMISIVRISLGDNNFDASTYLDQVSNTFFWIIWLMTAIICNIIFMNFIIAEVGASYNSVMETLHVTLLQERGDMINESEDMLRARYGTKKTQNWKHLFPNYIVKREQDQ